MMESQEQETKERNGRNGMVSLAEKSERHYTQPMPTTVAPLPRPFPPVLFFGLGLSIMTGALLGLLFGGLLAVEGLSISGWEGLFSLGRFTFHFYWTMMGAALGLFIGGVATILIVNAEASTTND